MDNVVAFGQTREYMLDRAARHRRAGRYDEAMALLTAAARQYGADAGLELERAAVYEAMDCRDEASRSYLRAARAGGAEGEKAFLRLAVMSAEAGDDARAVSFLGRLAEAGPGEASARELLRLRDALGPEEDLSSRCSRAERARTLEMRAIECLRVRRAFAAEMLLRRAAALDPSAQGYTLSACCAMLREDYQEAAEAAERAHALEPGNVQTLCVLADALCRAGREAEGLRALYVAAMRASAPEDLFAAAVEAGKHGEDKLALLLTKRSLRVSPFNTQMMALRACALANLGRLREASRLFGRLCGLLPEDTVYPCYYRMTRDGERPPERLFAGLDVPQDEAVARAERIGEALSGISRGEETGADEARELCAICAWALRSAQADRSVASAARMLLCAMSAPEARETALDALTDPDIPDDEKTELLQLLPRPSGAETYDVDMGGQFTRVLVSDQTWRAGDPPTLTGARVSAPAQLAADALRGDYPDAAVRVARLWNDYATRYGDPRRSSVPALACALVVAVREDAGEAPELREEARRAGVSPRLSRLFLARIRGAQGKRPDGEPHAAGSAPGGA